VLHKPSTDFETYREIMDDLLRPIASEGLDEDTLKRLYESKLVYLENLRQKCFVEINSESICHFTKDDHALIIGAIKNTRLQIRDLVLLSIQCNLSRLSI
jgi:hypothetical protein